MSFPGNEDVLNISVTSPNPSLICWSRTDDGAFSVFRLRRGSVHKPKSLINRFGAGTCFPVFPFTIVS